MLYTAYQAHADVMNPIRALAGVTSSALRRTADLMPGNPFLRSFVALNEMVARSRLTHHRPSFGIDSVKVGNREVAVRERAAYATPFGTLLHFQKDIDATQPRVLLVAPMSGHFATLLRATVETLLPEHDVYITDWHNARDVPLSAGRFGLDEYVDHVVRFLEEIGPGGHIIAVCQPCVQALAAVSVMSEDKNPATPRSMTLMAGPIDTRVSPTKVNELSTSKSIEWFERNLITRVPPRYQGGGRRVYPGFLQVSAFLGMNLSRHVRAHLDLFDSLATGDSAKANVTKTFYDEYFAVLDLPAEFYLETVKDVFQRHLLPKGKLTWHGRKVDPSAIRKTAMLTVEGERDDICAPGQTLAAHDLCSRLPPFKKGHHLQPSVGHYGVFSGRRWNNEVYPLVRNLILSND